MFNFKLCVLPRRDLQQYVNKVDKWKYLNNNIGKRDIEMSLFYSVTVCYNLRV